MSTILLADDDDDQRFLLSRMLQRAGFVTIDTHEGGQVASLAQARRPDVILLDVNMPDQDGFTTARELKDDPALADIPIIFVTGRLDAADPGIARDLGAVALLPKSIEPDELVRYVRAAAEHRHDERPQERATRFGS